MAASPSTPVFESPLYAIDQQKLQRCKPNESIDMDITTAPDNFMLVCLRWYDESLPSSDRSAQEPSKLKRSRWRADKWWFVKYKPQNCGGSLDLDMEIYLLCTWFNFRRLYVNFKLVIMYSLLDSVTSVSRNVQIPIPIKISIQKMLWVHS